MRLFTLFFLLSSFSGFAQCVPDASTNEQGIYPPTLATGCLNATYDDTLTIVFPVDTFVSNFTIPFDSFKVDMVNNLPSGLISECNLADCKAYPPAPGEPARACIRISGTPTSVPAIDSVELSITAWVTVFGNPTAISGIIQKVELPMHEVTIDNVVENNPLCFGQFSGSLEVTASSTGTITGYSFDNGANFLGSSTLGSLGGGFYDIVVQDNAGCQDNYTALLVYPPQINFDAFNQQTPTCVGGSNGTLDLEVSGGTPPYQYSVDGGVNYQASPAFSGLSAGSINIFVLDANGCSRNVAFNMFDGFQPDTSVTVGTNSITANSGSNRAWLDCGSMMLVPGETGFTFEPTVSGSYAYVTTIGGCTDTSACYYVEALSVGLNDQTQLLDAIQAYPNPTAGAVRVELGAKYTDVQCNVRNAMGQLVQTLSATDMEILRVHIDSQPGLYLMEITVDGALSKTFRVRKE